MQNTLQQLPKIHIVQHVWAASNMKYLIHFQAQWNSKNIIEPCNHSLQQFLAWSEVDENGEEEALPNADHYLTSHAPSFTGFGQEKTVHESNKWELETWSRVHFTWAGPVVWAI